MRGITILLLATLLIAAEPASAQLVNIDVDIVNNAFTPAATTAEDLDRTITWANNDPLIHRVSSKLNDVGPYFDTGEIAPNGDSPDIDLDEAGTFPYYCTIHPNMRGSVSVPVVPADLAALVGDSIVIYWSYAPSIPAGYVVDVQIKRKGARRWKSFASGTTETDGVFTPTRPGKYRFRARVRSPLTGEASRFSPASAPVVITAS